MPTEPLEAAVVGREAHVHKDVLAYIYVCICICICVYMYMYMYIYMYIYICASRKPKAHHDSAVQRLPLGFRV